MWSRRVFLSPGLKRWLGPGNQHAKSCYLPGAISRVANDMFHHSLFQISQGHFNVKPAKTALDQCSAREKQHRLGGGDFSRLACHGPRASSRGSGSKSSRDPYLQGPVVTWWSSATGVGKATAWSPMSRCQHQFSICLPCRTEVLGNG